MTAVPGSELGEHSLSLSLVSYEIVVNQEDIALEAEPLEHRQLCADLLRSFGTRHTAVDLDNVAKFTSKRATARELQRHGGVVIDVGQKLEARESDRFHIRAGATLITSA